MTSINPIFDDLVKSLRIYVVVHKRRNIFRSDRDRKAFLGFLGIAAKRFGWSVTA